MKYIKEIDGLRAIAIILVVLYHLKFPIFSGGYIGVDIFFVISGFLITSIILSEVNNNNFSLVNFFSRRIRRIFPILFFVLFVSSFFSYFLLKPKIFLLFIYSSISSALFFSNFFFFTKTGYFNELSYENPLFHTWSLSVEEQFYIFFPFLILFINKYLKSNYIFVFISFIIISFFLSIILFDVDKNASFYFTPSRIWELLFGSFIAVLPIKTIKINLIFRKLLSLSGLILILFSVFYFDENSVHPGSITFLPVLGSSLIILFANDETYTGKFLSNKFFSFVGLISYSLYLWHIPLYVFLKISFQSLDNNYFLFIYLISLLIISITSFYLIELPLKNKIKFKAHRFNLFFLFFIPLFILSSLFLLFLYNKKYKITDEYYEAQNDWNHPGSLKKGFLDGLWVTNPNNQLDILFFGDSHIEQYAPLAKNFSIKFNKNIGFYSKGGCPPLPNVLESKHPDCIDFFNNFIDILEKNKGIKKVVISGYFNSYFYKPFSESDKKYDDYGYNYFQVIDKSKMPLYESFQKHNAFIDFKTKLNKYKNIMFYFILDNPRSFNFDPNIHLEYKFDSHSTYFINTFNSFNPDKFKYDENQKRTQLNIVKNFSDFKNIKFLNIADFICPNDDCSVLKFNHFIYKDNNHLRSSYVTNFLRMPLEKFIFDN
jgi:peptidoglycan/LPS O-acetylase OafA/YrhL